NKGLCVITTRTPVADIVDYQRTSALRRDLEHLSSNAGAKLLRALGVKGDEAELCSASDEFSGHCLALTLLGSYLTDAFSGDIGFRKEVSARLVHDVRQGAHARKVMESYQTWFGEGPQLAVLRMLGLFDRNLKKIIFLCGDSVTQNSLRMWQRKINRRQLKPLAIWVTTCALLFSLCVPIYAGHVDFASYDVPLYEQVVNRIKAKGAPRLGEGKNTRDRYFIVPFAYQNKRNDPEFSHSFISVVHLFPVGKHSSFRSGFRRGRFKGQDFEAFTISWLPHDFDTNPHLCVFDGFGSRIVPKRNKCPISTGRNFTLEETLRFAVKAKNAVAMWGPYEIKKEAFDLGVKRKRLLDGETIRYRADDRLYRKPLVAINCFHAMAGLEELYPNGGFFGAGFWMWGINFTRRVVIEYTKAGRNKSLLLDPGNIKKKS